MFKIYHLVILLVVIYAAIWTSNRVPFIQNIVS